MKLNRSIVQVYIISVQLHVPFLTDECLKKRRKKEIDFTIAGYVTVWPVGVTET